MNDWSQFIMEEDNNNENLDDKNDECKKIIFY
jgi:hypothetical protein